MAEKKIPKATKAQRSFLKGKFGLEFEQISKPEATALLDVLARQEKHIERLEEHSRQAALILQAHPGAAKAAAQILRQELPPGIYPYLGYLIRTQVEVREGHGHKDREIASAQVIDPATEEILHEEEEGKVVNYLRRSSAPSAIQEVCSRAELWVLSQRGADKGS